jgi:hypothetical protein
MRDDRSAAAARDLHGDIGERRGMIEVAPQPHHQAHGRIEMGPRHREEDGDDDEQRGACRQRIA